MKRNLTKPYITFAIPAYNSEPFLHIALDSLSGFDDRIEVLVIDDGSIDKTLQVASSYASTFPFIKAIHQENKGHGGAVNTAIGLAKGLFFKVLDSDDWVNVETLDAILKDIELLDELPDIYVNDYTYWDGYEKISTVITYEKSLVDGDTIPIGATKRLLMKQNFTLHSTMFRTELLRDCGVSLPEHCSYDDNYLVYVSMCASKRIRYLHKSLYQYLVGREGQSMSPVNLFKKWSHIILTSELVYMHQDITLLKKTNKGLYRLLKHHLYLITAMVPFCCQMEGTKEGRKEMKAFFARCKAKYPKQYRLVSRHPVIAYMRIPGRLGHWATKIVYTIARSVVGFN